MYNRSIFIFRRDLRLEDNIGLLRALSASKEVVPIFIFDPASLTNNPYRGDNCLQFMLECLSDLDGSLRTIGSQLFVFQGKPSDVLAQIVQASKIDAVFVNHDYTPYSIERDAALKDTAIRSDIKFHAFNDLTLQKPESWRKDNGQPYSIYTPFARKMRQSPVARPSANTSTHYAKEIGGAIDLAKTANALLPGKNSRIFVHGGRNEALKIFAGIDRFKNYKEVRDVPAIDGTTGLAAHHKFGTFNS
jgi:deoxyribodipyrimidine photo-lyase